MDLADKLRPHISPRRSPNHRAINVEKKIGMTLYYLKDTGSLGMTANIFGVAIPTATAIIYEVCSEISTLLRPKYLCFYQKAKRKCDTKLLSLKANMV